MSTKLRFLLRLLPYLIVVVFTFFLLSIFTSRPAAQEPEEKKETLEEVEPITIKAAIKASKPQPKPKPVAAAAVVNTPVRITGPLSSAAIVDLGDCESGNVPTKNTGNGFYGNFQFTIGTWDAMGTGYSRADLAPYKVQVAAVQKLLSQASIFTQFPDCSLRLKAKGLI